MRSQCRRRARCFVKWAGASLRSSGKNNLTKLSALASLLYHAVFLAIWSLLPMPASPRLPWHRLFGIPLVEPFAHRLGFPDMAYTMQNFIRDTDRLFIANLTPEQRREVAAHLTPEARELLNRPN